MIDRLTGNAPELTIQEAEQFFGGLSVDEQEQAADLLWACESPEQRNLIYAQLRAWYTDARFGVN